MSQLLNQLRDIDSDYVDCIESLCVESVFYKPNLTVILPSDELRQKIVSLTYSNLPKDADLAISLISAHVIVDKFRTPAEFMERRDEIVNSLGQKVELAGVTGREIQFKGGAKVAFHSVGLAVFWQLLSGEITTTGPAAAKTARKKTDPVEVPVSRSPTRINLTNEIANAYIVSTMQRSENTSDPFVDCVLSFVSWLMKNEYCREMLVEQIIPQITFDKADFFIIFEPYRAYPPFRVSDRILNDWIAIRKPPHRGEIMRACDAILSLKKGKSANSIETTAFKTNALIYSNQQSAFTAIHERRAELIAAKIAPSSFIAAVRRSYAELFKLPILPDALKSYYGKPETKLAEDEFRFVIYQMFMSLESDPQFDLRKFHRIMEKIAEYCGGPEMQPTLFREPKSAGILPPNEKMAEIRIFVNSSMFFHMPLSEETLKAFPHEFVVIKPSPHSSAYFNIDECIKRRSRKHMEVFKTAKPDDIVAKLRALKADGKLDDVLKGL